MFCIKCGADLPPAAVFCHLCGKRQQAAPRKRKRRTTGSGSISKLSGKRSKPYLARMRGVMIGTFATVREAEQAISRLTDVSLTERYNYTFAQVYSEWFPEHSAILAARAETRGRGTTGMTGYAGAYKHCAALHDRTFRSLRKSDLQAVLNRMRADGLSQSSADKVRQLFGQLYQWAITEHIVLVNLADHLTVQPQRKEDPAVFTPDEIRRIAACPDPAASVALVLLGTGCRIGELFQVKTADCFPDYFIGGSKTDAGIGRVIPVAPIGLTAYRAMLESAQKRGTDLLIGGYDGNRNKNNYRKRDYYPMLDALNISRAKTPHKTRHAFATAAVSAGVRPEDLTRVLGHASYNTTLGIYTHQAAASLISAVQQVTFTDHTPDSSEK